MRGKWSSDVDLRHSSATFSAGMNMETSDYGITQTIVVNGVTQSSVNKDDPATRGAHTHHISMTDGVVTSDWSSCPTFKAPVTGEIVVTGTAFITGNGGPAPLGNPSPLTLCVLGGTTIKYSNMTLISSYPRLNISGYSRFTAWWSGAPGHGSRSRQTAPCKSKANPARPCNAVEVTPQPRSATRFTYLK